MTDVIFTCAYFLGFLSRHVKNKTKIEELSILVSISKPQYRKCRQFTSDAPDKGYTNKKVFLNERRLLISLNYCQIHIYILFTRCTYLCENREKILSKKYYFHFLFQQDANRKIRLKKFENYEMPNINISFAQLCS